MLRFPTRSDTYQAAQPEVLNFRFRKNRVCTIYVVKAKALISCVVNAFAFAYTKSKFSHDAVNFCSISSGNIVIRICCERPMV